MLRFFYAKKMWILFLFDSFFAVEESLKEELKRNWMYTGWPCDVILSVLFYLCVYFEMRPFDSLPPYASLIIFLAFWSATKSVQMIYIALEGMGAFSHRGCLHSTGLRLFSLNFIIMFCSIIFYLISEFSYLWIDYLASIVILYEVICAPFLFYRLRISRVAYAPLP
jgi:hypothetical protein